MTRTHCRCAQSKLLPADRSAQLPTAYGVTARFVDDIANGAMAGGALSAPPAGPLTDVALFIDSSSQDLGASASTKQIVIGIGGGGWGGGESVFPVHFSIKNYVYVFFY